MIGFGCVGSVLVGVFFLNYYKVLVGILDYVLLLVSGWVVMIVMWLFGVVMLLKFIVILWFIRWVWVNGVWWMM